MLHARMEAASLPIAAAPPLPRPLLRLQGDAGLLERYRHGDDRAFGLIYDRHRALVFAVAVGVLSSREDAEDVTQEVFATASQALRRGAPRELRPWLARSEIGRASCRERV